MTRSSIPALLVLSILLAAGCARTLKRELIPPDEVRTVDRRSEFLKVHMSDGHVYLLAEWDVDEPQGMVRGNGRLFGPNRLVLDEGNFQIPLDSVVLFETNTIEISPAVTAMAVITGISVAVTMYCASNPKACFGSCPTFYVADGEENVLRAEGFSSSIAPSLEATDVDALVGVEPAASRLEIVMRNEALETHVVRHVNVLAASRASGERVFASANGDFWRASLVMEPTSGAAPEGDCLEALRRTDGLERFSPADSTDLTMRETIEIEFPQPPPGRLGLVIGARQTLLSTYLLYQSFAWMGRSAGDYLAALERGDPWIEECVRGLGEPLGAIEIFVPSLDGGWILAGTAHEVGPLATDVRVVPLPEGGPAPARVRLRLTRGHWRIDSVHLARLTERVEPRRVRPSRVLRDGADDVDALARLLDPNRVLTTLPGDEYSLQFDLPTTTDAHELFLESRGYYLEWMREEWMEEEDPQRLAAFFLNPAAAFQRLAPEFKEVEPQMEAAFWRSRYAH